MPHTPAGDGTLTRSGLGQTADGAGTGGGRAIVLAAVYRFSALVLAVALGLGACSESEETRPATQVPTTAGEARELDPSGGVDGPVMYWRQPTPPSTGATALIDGRLERDGDCLYVRRAGEPSERFPIVLQYGTTWRTDPPGVVLPDGTVVGIGDRVRTGGGYFRAGSLARYGAGSALIARAEECAEGPYREVAVVHWDVEVEPDAPAGAPG